MPKANLIEPRTVRSHKKEIQEEVGERTRLDNKEEEGGG